MYHNLLAVDWLFVILSKHEQLSNTMSDESMDEDMLDASFSDFKSD